MRSYNSFIDDFCNIRRYIEEVVEDKLLSFRSGLWDNISKYMIVHEISHVMEELIQEDYPEIPKRFFPKIKYKTNENGCDIEVMIQSYLNTEDDLLYLGTQDINSITFDLYLKQNDHFRENLFIAKYGHDDECKFTGSYSAHEEYIHGVYSPLSVAYELGVEYGYVE